MIVNIFVFLFFWALTFMPALAIWSAESIPVKLRAVMVIATLFILCLAVIAGFIKKLEISDFKKIYGENVSLSKIFAISNLLLYS